MIQQPCFDMEVLIDDATTTPIYTQIIEQAKRLIAAERLKPGEHLPPVRKLAQDLQINPGTVARAYKELEREGIVVSRRGGGTIVSAAAQDPRVSVVRQARLANRVSSHILETLSLGYSTEELEAAFALHLARWREERHEAAQAVRQPGKRSGRDTIVIVGSHDLALTLLASEIRQKSPSTRVEITHVGSLSGLIALQQERADLAGVHLLDDETGEYNRPYVKRLLPGQEVVIVHLAYRLQGLVFAKNNPKEITEIRDVQRSDITMVNRQAGSGTRVLLDLELRKRGISSAKITGYDRELDTHLAMATSIDRGEADVGLGIEAAAKAYDLGFLPLFKERYDLVIPITKYRSKLLAPLVDIVMSEEFRRVVDNVGGYDTSQTGTTTYCE
jgi:molybdate-binding protein/DNA-binding transcriptional regulator YhcF (GntR family)